MDSTEQARDGSLMPPRHRPRIVAHRGASRDATENTLRAFALALDQGADGIELDVHATRDGVCVVHHDAQLPASNGRRDAIADLTWAELAERRLPSGDPVPTLAAVFDLVGARATMYVEVKGRGIEALVASVLDAYPQVDSAVHAFDHRIPVALKARRPSTPIGLLSTSYPLSLDGVLADSAARTLWQHVDQIDEALVHAVHARGLELMAWTANDIPHARLLAAWGVDGLCTDLPGAMRAALAG
jgi:glycerophosphoryl diester phosphodiesterase